MQTVSVAMPSGLSLRSSSVNSSTSTALTVIVAVAGFFSTEISSFAELLSGFEFISAAEVAFLRYFTG